MAILPTEQGIDRGQAPTVIAEVERRCGRTPLRLLADSTAMTEQDIVGFAASHAGMKVSAPPKKCSETAKPASRGRYERKLAAERLERRLDVAETQVARLDAKLVGRSERDHPGQIEPAAASRSSGCGLSTAASSWP